MIPLSVPNISGKEWEYVKECLDTEWVSSAGKYVEKFEQEIASYTKSKYAIACTNGTSALQVCLRLAGVENDTEVIVPSLTFIAPVNAISYNNANPIFMDVDEFYNIDIGKTLDFIEKETFYKNGFTYNNKNKKRISAIIPVHMWGNAANLEELVNICRERNISIVEDSSESLGTSYLMKKFKGKHTGTIGDFGCLSFNGNKIITTGGGGMILTNNLNFAEKAKYLTTQAKDDPVRYVHNEVGYNFRLTNIQAAIGVAQLEKLPDFLKRKKAIFNEYKKEINEIPGLSIALTPGYSDNNHWLNLLKIDKRVYKKNREAVLEMLKKNGIQTRPVWKLNHEQKPYKKFQCYKIENSQDLVSKSLCLPSSTNLLDNEIKKIVKILRDHG